jgi:PilZ domain
MDRKKFTISVVPDSINRASSSPSIDPDKSAEWDARWLRPNLAVATPNSQQPEPEPVTDAESEQSKSGSFALRILRWLFPDVNQRRATRFHAPNLVAYYWTGGSSYSYHVGDISATGLFLLTKERWAPGTLIQMTLQKQDGRADYSDNSICVLSELVRWGENGAGFNFVLADYENVSDYGILPMETVKRKSIERFLQKIGVPASH